MGGSAVGHSGAVNIWELMMTEQVESLEVLLASFMHDKPLILAGAGVMDHREKFYAFIERHQIPTMLTWKAMELLPDDHPLFVGRPGAIAQPAANRLMQQCDLLIVLGACMNYDQVAYQLEKIAPRAVKIVVDTDKVELSKYSSDWIKINADLASVL